MRLPRVLSRPSFKKSSSLALSQRTPLFAPHNRNQLLHFATQPSSANNTIKAASRLSALRSRVSALLTAQGDTPPSVEALQTSHELALADWRRFTEIGLGGWGDGNANRRVAALLDKLDGGKLLGSEQAYVDAMQREFPV